ncbi:retrovirus-related pol polyprotein from transposon tnt 1-94 [Lasius niger]|uniref:Retrovirus-related pol polyprotein from transposon tnt 1-94 n=1 Tax=Lasius niger TaxID=67767 RepID=A0A0J7K0Q7_LASNI|nr:retrovirus-related pol polyprotein from transposon tnt 1-94 [Lasius niger]
MDEDSKEDDTQSITSVYEDIEDEDNQEQEREEGQEEEKQEEVKGRENAQRRKEEISKREHRQAQEEEDEENKPERPRRTRKLPERYGDYVFMTYTQATTGPDKNKWTDAINEEKRSLKENNTWDVVCVEKLPQKDIKPLISRWIFKIKSDGKYKARLVVQGCEQKYGMNYEETYSPVVSTNALRILLALAAMKNYKIITFDIKTAFLYGQLDEDIYMYPLEGNNYKDKICKLRKALYGLKQSPLNWNYRFTDFLRQKGSNNWKQNTVCLKDEME